MANPAAGHIRKRPYQPSITSYFNTCNADPNAHSQLLRSSTSPLSPPLPADTQASLLSVGMRVRKSVPEGYKTHKTLGTPGFPFPSSAQPAPSRMYNAKTKDASTRELVPFCGLHKTGGLEVPPSSAPAAMQTETEEESDSDNLPPGMTMSQTTLSSTQGSFMSSASAPFGASRKRSYDEEVEDDLDAYFDDMDATEQAEQPKYSRPMARIKSALRKAATDGMVGVVGGDDFEEAAFLAPPVGMDLDQ